MPTVNIGPLSVTFSLSNLLLGVIGVTTSIGGMSGQIIALNFWLNGFSTVDSPFTVLTLVAMTVAVVYSAGLAIWAFKKRPKLRFAIQPGCIIFGLACGFCYSLNGLLLVYATPDTPELIQVMLISTGVFWTFFTACFVHLFKVGCRAACRLVDRRALMVPFAFALCAGGIVLGAGSFNMTSLSYDEKKWTIIFAVAQIPGAVFNVMAAEYMNLYSDPSDINLNTTAGTISQPNLDDDRLDDQLNSYSLVNPYAPKRYTSDPTTVKMMLLAVSAVGQMFCLWAYFPVNWIDGFGADGTAEVARANLATNYQCVFFGCPASTNFWYFVAFAISYAATLVGSAILNHFSAPLCSMVTQVATPFADLILVIFPVLNVDKQPYNVGDVIGALILITVGSIVYVVWSRFMQPVEEPLPPQQQQYVVYPPAPQQQMLYQQVVVQQFVVEQHRVVEGCETA